MVNFHTFFNIFSWFLIFFLDFSFIYIKFLHKFFPHNFRQFKLYFSASYKKNVSWFFALFTHFNQIFTWLSIIFINLFHNFEQFFHPFFNVLAWSKINFLHFWLIFTHFCFSFSYMNYLKFLHVSSNFHQIFNGICSSFSHFRSIII